MSAPIKANLFAELMELIVDTLLRGYDARNKSGSGGDGSWAQNCAHAFSTLQLTLASVCLLNTAWYAVTIEKLYSNVYLASPTALSKFRRTLARSKRKLLLREYVQGVIFSRFSQIEHANEVDQLLPRRIQHNITAICNMCPNVEASTIMRKDLGYKRNLLDVIRRRRSSSTVHPLNSGAVLCHNFTHLTLQSPPSRNPNPSLADLYLPKLRELVLIDFTSMGTLTNRLELPSSMPSLLALRLIDCSFWGQHMPFPDAAPQLRLLEVINGIIATQKFWDALARVSETLESVIITARHLSASNRGFNFSSLVNVLEFRVRISYCIISSWPDPVLPPSVRTLVVEHGRYLDNNSIGYIEKFVKRVLENRPANLNALIIHHTPYRDAKMNEAELLDLAKRAGVCCTFYNHSSAWWRNIIGS